MIGAVEQRRPLAGGDIAPVESVRTDRGHFVVKRPPYDARLEADGLRALERAGAPVPEVVHVTESVLVLEHVGGSPTDGAELGAALADVHRTSADAFGWERDNLIGSLPQRNPWTRDWPEFYVEHRIRPYLDALPDELAQRLRGATDGPLQELLTHDVTPSLVHGDLWSGNVIDGRWLIDPAVHYADREFELAFATLFGGLPPKLLSSYEQAWPLDDGWRRRRPALQLYHLLVHVRLFGASWLSGIAQRLDQLGW